MTNKKTTNTTKADVKYGYYSKLLKEPFDSLNELTMAEEAYYAKQKAKEDAVAQKKADAQKVEDAFKALNAARKDYKENLTILTKEYAAALDNLKKTFDFGKKDILNKLAEAEEAFQVAHKEFSEKHPEGFHLTLRDGDVETTISKQTSDDFKTCDIIDIFASLFNW